jgi:hypothetical protein
VIGSIDTVELASVCVCVVFTVVKVIAQCENSVKVSITEVSV